MGCDITPKIGITQRVFTNSYGERCDCLDQRWAMFVRCFGGCLIPLPNSIDRVSDFIDSLGLNAVILSGGNDLNKYGGDATERDLSENKILDYGIEKDLPIIGVCRGMQVIHDHFGYALEKLDAHSGLTHEIQVHGGKRIVNSYHNWGLTTAHPDFSVWATAPDGSVEAFSCRYSRIHGIMWHPERNKVFDSKDLAFFARVLCGSH